MEYRILGAIEARDDGALADLGPPKQRAVLGLLALHPGETVSTERLIDMLWGDAPPRTASHSIQTYVSGLRSALGAATVETSPPGYRLDASSDSVDAGRFEHLAREGARALEAGDPAGASASLAGALELWRGDPLADVADQLAGLPEARRLDELHLWTLERWCDAEMALGRSASLVPELERLTRLHPLREPLWSRRMLALYRSGRAAEALRAYQQLRSILGEELGVEPSEEIRTLEERILLQDPLLGSAGPPDGAAGPSRPPSAARNPYKGLRPFGVDDAGDFFGRSTLVRQLLDAVADPGRPLVALVGPSGSGKSSALRAGLIPAVAGGRLPGEVTPSVVLTLPGVRPLSDLAGALHEAIPGLPGDLEARIRREGLAPALAGIRRPILIAVDQFEEVFTLAPEDERRVFLDELVAACGGAGLPVTVVIALRADFYDRPLLHPRFGRLVAAGTVQVMPLDVDELEEAAERPAAAVGVALEPGLLAALAADLTDQPGALPQFQYALTELFERRRGDVLTLEGYRAVGGIAGALTRRAEELYATFDRAEQEAAAQLALRLIAPAVGGAATRRRVPAPEIAALDVDPVAMQAVVERLGRHRLLSFDRDPASGRATVELAHEALIDGWDRLHDWVEQGRDDLRIHDALVTAMGEWQRSGEDSGYLLTGSRLEEYERWAERGSMRLTAGEHRFLAASLERRDAERALEEERRTEREALGRRASRRLWVGVGAGVVAVAAIVVLVVALLPKGPKVALLYEGRGSGTYAALMAAGLDRADDAFDIRAREIVPLADVAGEVEALCRSGYDLVILGGAFYGPDGVLATPECSGTRLVFADSNAPPDADCTDWVTFLAEIPRGEAARMCEVTAFQTFTDASGAYLAGAAAAMATETGIVGFVGGQPWALIESARAGFEAGAARVDPGITVLATHVSHSEDPVPVGFNDPVLGTVAAEQLYRAGADIVFEYAGDSGDGILDAAVDLSAELGRHLWMIGIDEDNYLSNPRPRRDHVLTSIVKRFDRVVYDSIARTVDGGLPPGIWLTGLAEGGIDYSDAGGFIEAYTADLDAVKARVVSGDIAVPTEPVGDVLPAADLVAEPTDLATARFDGSSCAYDGPDSVDAGGLLRVTFTNDTDRDIWIVSASVTGEMPPVREGPDDLDIVDPRTRRGMPGPTGEPVAYDVSLRAGVLFIGCADWGDTTTEDDDVIYRATQIKVVPSG